MKSIIVLFFALISLAAAEVSTFDGNKFSWSWSDKTKYSKQAVIEVLRPNQKADPLSLQEKLDSVTSAELLWKVTPDLVDKAMKTKSSFLTGEKVDHGKMSFEASGKVEIILYSQGRIVGRVRACTVERYKPAPPPLIQNPTAKEREVYKKAVEESEKPRQLAQGTYTVMSTKRDGWSKEFNCPMPNLIRLDGMAKQRGITMHNGDTSGEDPGRNNYHGCIRFSELTGQQFMKIISEGTTFEVVWK